MKAMFVSLIAVLFAATQLAPAQPSITILSPRKGDRWSGGIVYPIRWSAVGVDSVRIDYSTTGMNGPWLLIVSGIPSNWNAQAQYNEPEGDINLSIGTFFWPFPVSPAEDCYVRVSDKSNPTIFDKKRFTIVRWGTWNVQVSFVDQPLYAAHAVDNSGLGWVAGRGGVVLRTMDAGMRWQSAGVLHGDVRAITSTLSDLVLAATVSESGTSRIVRTSDGGNVWSVADSTSAVLRDIHLFNERVGYALGDPLNGYWTLKRTTNGGTMWADVQPRTPARTGEHSSYHAMVWSDSLFGWFGTNHSRVFRTTDGGLSWTPIRIQEGTVNVTALSFVSNTFGLAGTADGRVSRTIDGGLTWRPATMMLPSAVVSLAGLKYGKDFWAACGKNVYHSQDSGKTWVSSEYGGFEGETELRHLALFGRYWNGFGWAVGDEGTIVRFWRIITGAPDNTNGVVQRYALNQNYPNPFNPTTTIRFTVPANVGTGPAGIALAGRHALSLRVYDVLGREVATLVNEVKEPGTHSVQWNASAVASGVYLYQLSAGEFVQTRKMLLLR